MLGEARAVVTATGMKTRIGRAIAATHAAGEEYLTFGGDARSGRRGDDAGAGAASWFPLTTASSFDRVLSDVVYVLSAAGLVVCACLSVTLLVWGGGGGGGGGTQCQEWKGGWRRGGRWSILRHLVLRGALHRLGRVVRRSAHLEWSSRASPSADTGL